MSKIEAGKLTLSPIDYDFQAMIESVVTMFSYVAKNKGLQFIYENEGEIPKYQFGDDIRLRQVLTNICGNAVKFTEKGYVKLKAVARQNEKRIEFQIIDTGMGIREEDIPKLFHAFEQSKTEKNRGIAGTGLGLVISKAFVEMMGGTVTLQSEYGKGTVFTIVIPDVPGDGEKVKRDDDVKKIHSISAPDAKILVVDDNEYNLKVACGLLELFEIKAQTAVSGKRAIEMVKENDYDIVFMDHMMPDMDGIEATAAIRALGEKYKKLPVIALSANALQGAKEMFIENGLSAFLSKPIEIPALLQILTEWLPKEKITVKTEANANLDEKKEKEHEDFLEAIKKIDEIEYEIGLRRVDGKIDMYMDNMKLFYEKLFSDNEKLTIFFENDDFTNFSIMVHALKSMLASIGAQELSSDALNLETASKDGDVKYCRKNFQQFSQKLAFLHEQLGAVFPKEAETKKKKGDASFLSANVQKAIAAVKDYNTDAGTAVLKELLAYDFGKEKNTLLNNAVKALKEYQYDETLEFLMNI
jgi:CheY-like chemotaxis protein/HPt (histidine-containing phosphotransfer) domain-containing protein/anti-sigma regulatory factor (Ser/Thr protein kinase)